MKNSYLIVFLTFFTSALYAQHIIEYNFNKETPFKTKENFTVKDGELIIIKIKDVNPFLYKVTISSDFHEYNTTMPTSFSNYLINFKDTQVTTTKKSDEKDPYINFKNGLTDYKSYADMYQQLLYLVHTDGISIIEIENKRKIITSDNDNDLPLIIQTAIDNINKYYIEFREKYPGDDKADLDLKTKKALIDEFYKKLTDAKFENLPYDFKKLLNKINSQNFTFKSSLLKAKKDEITFTVNITPIDDDDTKKFGNGNRNEKFEIPVEVLSGFKIDFSTGIFVSNLIDYKYVTMKDSSYSNTDTLRGYKISRNDEGGIKFGLLALAHAYYRFSTTFNVGLNFGVGIIPDQSVNYMGGISIMFGKTKRFIFNGGGSLGYVTRLSSLVNENTLYNEIPLNSNFTVKKLTLGWYLGLSYNLTE